MHSLRKLAVISIVALIWFVPDKRIEDNISQIMIPFLILIEIIIFLILAAIHFNWALGNDWGFENSIPTKDAGGKILNPKKIDSAFVGFGLSTFALYYIYKVGAISLNLPDWINWAGWIIPAIFIFRAIGDFKYVGFFKRIKNTTFAKMDSIFYAPLCLGIGLIGVFIKLVS